jgi:hypothetical protein
VLFSFAFESSKSARLCSNSRSMSRRSHLLAIAALALGCTPPAGAQAVVGDVYSSDASIKGTIMLAGAGMRVFSGSQVSAGAQSAVLKLARGGEVKVCPGTNLTVSASSNGSEMLFSVSTGALEFHYAIDSGADSIITPDFQLRLTGPGEYHIGIGADQRGATCVRGLQRNNALVSVTEMLGDGRYQVQPNEEVVFHDGRVNTATAGALVHCGCPDPPAPVIRAEAKPAVAPATQSQPPVQDSPPAEHVQVDAPFVFRGDKTEPDVPYTLLRLTTREGNDLALKLVPTVLPPPELASKTQEKPKVAAAADKNSGGFFKKVGRFFSRMFRG